MGNNDNYDNYDYSEVLNEEESLDIESARILCHVIKNLSENRYCAGWRHGIEFTLWQEINNPYCQSYDINPLLIGRLAEKAGGWIIWSDISNCEIFITMADWIKYYIRYR